MFAWQQIGWRILGSLITFALVWVWSEKPMVAALVVAVEFPAKLLIRYLWDRFPVKEPETTTPELQPVVLWFTGLSGAGKTTLARAVESLMQAEGVQAAWLDGDVTREIFPRTGFSKDERDAHVLKAGFVAKMLVENGVTVISSYISPYRETRRKVREMCSGQSFIEIHVATPLEECERRDVKGLYAKARAGEIRQFTGIDDPYEAPEHPELTIDTLNNDVDTCARQVLDWLRQNRAAP